MVKKCCETCDNNKDCPEWFCTRAPHSGVPKDEQDIKCTDTNWDRNKKYDAWVEGESMEHILYRIRELEKKTEGV